MKRSQYFGALTTALTLIALTGCGGSGGGDNSSGGGGGGGGNGSTFQLTGQVKMTGGFNLNQTYVAGTDTLVLTDGEGHNTTFGNIVVPVKVTGFMSVIRAGSKLFGGTYSGATAQCLDLDTNAQASVPLNADGTLKQDTALGADQCIIVPVTADGQLTFSNGIQVFADASNLGDNRTDITVTMASNSGSMPTGSTGTTFGGSLSFAGGGTVQTTASLNVRFANAAIDTVLTASGNSIAPSKTTSISGIAVGQSLPFVSNAVKYQVSL